MPLEYKALGLELKASATDEGAYEGYFSTYAEDDGGDTIMPGAFTKTLTEGGRRLRVLYQHDPEKLIGPAPQQVHEDSKGLFAAGHLTLGTFWGAQAWALMKDQALTEGSIGYSSIPARTDHKAGGGRTLHELKLFEISPVPWGMNPATAVRAVKALWAAGDPGTAGEETLDALITLTTEIKAGRMLSAASLERVQAAHVALMGALPHLQALLDAAAPREVPDGTEGDEPEAVTDAAKLAHPAPLDKERLRLLTLAAALPPAAFFQRGI